MADPSRLRRRAERRGQVTEYFAALVLLLKGYRVVAMRYRTKVGEVDIIARKGDLAVFVEVKAKVGEREAIDAVGVTAQRRIRAASDAGFHGAATPLTCHSATRWWPLSPTACRGIFRMPSDAAARKLPALYRLPLAIRRPTSGGHF